MAERIGVLGAGVMGSGIAQVLAVSGCEVVCYDTDENALTLTFDLHVREQAGGIKVFQRRIECYGVDCAIGGRMELRADHVRIDVPVAGDDDR